HHSEAYYVTLSRVLTAVFGVLQMGVAWVAFDRAGPNTVVVKQVLAVAGFTTGLILGLFLLGRMKRPVSSAAAVAGLVAGFLVVLGVWLPSTWDRPILAWPWYAPVGAGTTVAVALLVSALSGPPNGPARPAPDGSP